MADFTDGMSDEELSERVAELNMLFEQLCRVRHEEGQLEYGEFSFLKNDMMRMMIEELVDTANYIRYQVIKLLMANERMMSELETPEMGAQAFKGTGTGWKDDK